MENNQTTQNVQTQIPTTMYAYLKKKTKINPHEVEEKFVALMQTEEYKNFLPKKVERIIDLHSEYIEHTAKSIHERGHVAKHKRILKQSDKALETNPNDEIALNNKEISTNDLVGHNAYYDEHCQNLSDSLIALNAELEGYIAEFNKAHPENPFIPAVIPVKTSTVKKKKDVDMVKPQTACTALVPAGGNLPTAAELYGSQGAAQASLVAAPQRAAIPAIGPATTEKKEPKKQTKAPSNIKAPGTEDEKPADKVKNAETPAAPAPEKEAEKKPEKKPEVKKTELITTSLAFLIAAITFGLLIAGVGVAGWLVPAICATSSVIAAGGSGVLTLHYIDEKKAKKTKEQKAKEKLQKAMDKQKSKELKAQKKMQKQQNKTKTITKSTENQQTQPKVKKSIFSKKPIVADYTPESTETIETENTTQPQTQPTQVQTGITNENLQLLKNAIAKEKELRNNPSQAAEHAKAVEDVIKITQAINPDNAHVLTFAEEDQAVIQGCNDILTAYIANGSAISDTEETTSNISSTTDRLNKKPSNKKTKQTLDAQTEELGYNQDIVNKTLEILNEKIDNLGSALDEKLGVVAEKIENPIKQAPKTPKKPKTNTALIPKIPTAVAKASKEPNEKIVDLKNKFDYVVKNKGANSQQDYSEVVDLSKDIIKDLETRTSLTSEEKQIMELCQKLVEQDETRASIEAEATALNRDLEKLELEGEKEPEKKDEHKIEEIKTQLNTKAEEHLNTMDATKETLHNLGNQVKSYVDGTTYSKETEGAEQNK